MQQVCTSYFASKEAAMFCSPLTLHLQSRAVWKRKLYGLGVANAKGRLQMREDLLAPRCFPWN